MLTGSGTESDPYVFEWLDIDGSKNSNPDYSGIYIENLGSSIYLEIKNCILKNWNYKGIEIRYSDHITIFNCTISNNGEFGGIYLQRAWYCNISNNLIDHNSGFGIMTATDDESSDNVIAYNTITNTYFKTGEEHWTGSGIGWEQGHRNQIIYNTITNNAAWGIRFGGIWYEDSILTTDNYIAHNDLCNNGLGGINFEEMVDTDVNTFEDNTCGEVNGGGVFDNIPGFSLEIFLIAALFSSVLLIRKYTMKNRA